MTEKLPPETLEVNGKIIRFGSIYGEIAGSHKHAETHVYGGGGGGGDYAASNVVIRSDVTVKQEFFVKTRDGKEWPVQLSGLDIPIRDGQPVTMVSARVEGRDEFFWVRLVNHAAGRWWETRRTEFLMERWMLPSRSKRVLIGIGSAVAALAAALAIGLIEESVTKRAAGPIWVYGTILSIGLAPFLVNRWMRSRLRDAAGKRFDERCKVIVDWAFRDREEAVAPSAKTG